MFHRIVMRRAKKKTEIMIRGPRMGLNKVRER